MQLPKGEFFMSRILFPEDFSGISGDMTVSGQSTVMQEEFERMIAPEQCFEDWSI